MMSGWEHKVHNMPLFLHEIILLVHDCWPEMCWELIRCNFWEFSCRVAKGWNSTRPADGGCCMLVSYGRNVWGFGLGFSGQLMKILRNSYELLHVRSLWYMYCWNVFTLRGITKYIHVYNKVTNAMCVLSFINTHSNIIIILIYF